MIAIRVDANREIATGHVMRCMSIAGKLCDLGQKPVFITADNSVTDLILSNGYMAICLNTVWNDMDSEIDNILKIIKNNDINTLFVDSYYVTKKYLKSLSGVTKIFYIDDLNMFEYPVDTVINYNIYANKFDYENKYKMLGMNTKFLLGCHYVPLRKEFENISYRVRRVVKNILITTGGTDNYNIAGRLLKILVRQEWTKMVKIHVVEGIYNINKDFLDKLSKQHNNIVLYRNVQNISRLMLNCDIAVSAGGFTLYELCRCGVPTISISFVDNQLDNVKQFDKEEVIIYAGDVREDLKIVLKKVVSNIEVLLSDCEVRLKYSEKMKNLKVGCYLEKFLKTIY